MSPSTDPSVTPLDILAIAAHRDTFFRPLQNVRPGDEIRLVSVRGTFVYRVRDTKGNDQFEDIELLKKIPGGGEHGPHAVVLGPDKMLYVIAGNHTKLVEGVSPNSPHKNYAEDFVLPRQWDGNGHAAGILAPGGHIYRTDFDGKNWELMLAGFRNAYDFAFNADGEIFTFDSDM